MTDLALYEITPAYISYLSSYVPHLFLNKSLGQKNERKYIGIVFTVNGFDYFAPLSSFKDKHKRMQESVDFIKIKDYAVINLNNMFPVPPNERKYVNISKEKDPHYRALLLAEYRYIKSIREKIQKTLKTFIKSNLKTAMVLR